jgi:hypothetical protein
MGFAEKICAIEDNRGGNVLSDSEPNNARRHEPHVGGYTSSCNAAPVHVSHRNRRSWWNVLLSGPKPDVAQYWRVRISGVLRLSQDEARTPFYTAYKQAEPPTVPRTPSRLSRLCRSPSFCDVAKRASSLIMTAPSPLPRSQAAVGVCASVTSS